MLSHHTHTFTDLQHLAAAIDTGDMAAPLASAQAVLVQVYAASADRAQLQSIADLIARKLPRAALVGATTVGEIAHGRLLTGQTVIGFTCFASSRITVIDLPCARGQEHGVGSALGRQVAACAGPVAGVLLLSTPLSLDAAALLLGLESTVGGHLVFGGGAGDYAAMDHSLVLAGTRCHEQGAVAVVFTGAALRIEAHSYLGWRPLSKPMRVTQASGQLVTQVDDAPAFEIYRRYLNIAGDQDFFLNALEFPFLFERDGHTLARVPVAVTPEGALQFVADIQEGETLRIGYGDFELIVDDARQIHHTMAHEAPQAIFLFTCGCRRFLMQEDVELETLPFEALAPTFGFYTYGEFFGTPRLSLLNATMVAVGLREGPAQARAPLPAPQACAAPSPDSAPEPARDPYAHKHTRIVSRLMRFIDAVTSELEAANREVTLLSITDRLTGLANRVRLDQVLDENLQQARRYARQFAVILLDIDHFKRVNDVHGHLVGDEVLARVAQVLTQSTRSVDTVGRWGGEEFVVIAPALGLPEAALLAEKLRAALAATEHPTVGTTTSSLGVAAYQPGDDCIALMARADTALYQAKHAGRNRVALGGTA